MKHSISLFLAAALALLGTARAEVICVKKDQAVSEKRNKVALATAITVEQTACKKGFTQLLDTASFKGDTGASGAPGAKGEKGDRGAAALGHSNCERRTQQFIKVIDDLHRDFNFSKSCGANEYAHALRVNASYLFSNDWNANGDGSAAGASGSFNNTDFSYDLANDDQVWMQRTSRYGATLNVYDAADLLLTGYKETVRYTDGLSGTIAGSLTYTYEVTLTCCALAE